MICTLVGDPLSSHLIIKILSRKHYPNATRNQSPCYIRAKSHITLSCHFSKTSATHDCSWIGNLLAKAEREISKWKWLANRFSFGHENITMLRNIYPWCWIAYQEYKKVSVKINEGDISFIYRDISNKSLIIKWSLGGIKAPEMVLNSRKRKGRRPWKPSRCNGERENRILRPQQVGL